MNKTYKYLCLLLVLSLALLAIPVHAGASDQALDWSQADKVTPGEDATLTLSLPDVEMAGGFITVAFDHTLFTLKEISLAPEAQDLHLTYAVQDGELRILLDAAQNVYVQGAFLTLSFATSEEIQPGNYTFTCTVPDVASFYTVADDGTTAPLHLGGCVAKISVTDPPLPPSPVRYLACQETNPSGDSFFVRMCAAADGTQTLAHYGFVVRITDTEGERELTLHGSAMTDQIDGGTTVYTAAELGADVLYTATLTLSAKGEVTVSVTPYATVGDQNLYGGTYTVRYLDSVYMGTN